MLSPETTYLVKQEQHKDRIRQLQQQQLLQQVGLNNEHDATYKKAIGWLGNRMVKWGAKLENYGTPAHSKAMTLKT